MATNFSIWEYDRSNLKFIINVELADGFGRWNILPRCFEIDAIISQNITNAHIAYVMVDSVAVNDAVGVETLLSTSAIIKKVNAIQPEITPKELIITES